MADSLAWKIPWTEGNCRLLSMGSQSRTGLSDFLFTFYFHALEKEMATHSSVLAWRIPGMWEPGRPPPCQVAQNRTQLKRLSSSSSIHEKPGFLCGSAGKKKCLQCWRPGFDPWVGMIPWRRKRLFTPVFWPGEFHGLYNLWGCKELDPTE